jgi:hypothetical protein
MCLEDETGCGCPKETEMNNEPVAWIKQGRLGYPILEFDKPFRYESYAIQNQPIPLYTHPAKTLTDEEIIEIRDSCYVQSGIDEWEFDDITFAREILRKAQDK